MINLSLYIYISSYITESETSRKSILKLSWLHQLSLSERLHICVEISFHSIIISWINEIIMALTRSLRVYVSILRLLLKKKSFVTTYYSKIIRYMQRVYLTLLNLVMRNAGSTLCPISDIRISVQCPMEKSFCKNQDEELTKFSRKRILLYILMNIGYASDAM